MFTSKFSLLWILVLILSLFIFITSCSKSDNTIQGPPTDNSFVADNSTFIGYKNWQQDDYSIYTSCPTYLDILNDDDFKADINYVRIIYTKPGSDGNVFVKETFKVEDGKKIYPEIGGILAKAIHTTNNSWEFFILDEDGSIGTRSYAATSEPLNECTICHNAALSH